jgi:hypothetical protein
VKPKSTVATCAFMVLVDLSIRLTTRSHLSNFAIAITIFYHLPKLGN